MQNSKTTFLAFMAVIMTVGVLFLTNRAVTPKDATWNDVQAEAKSGGYRLISTEQLAARYQKEPDNLLLVDTRQDWEYRTGHLKGAVLFSMEPTWWSRWRKASALEAFLGPDKDRMIIFY
jgi:hypothetical protein